MKLRWEYMGALILCGTCGLRDCPNAHDHDAQCTMPPRMPVIKPPQLPKDRRAERLEWHRSREMAEA